MLNDSQIRDTVAGNVKALRADKGWTLEQLSERLDEVGYPISLQVLWKTEQMGKHGRKITVDDLVGLARAFGVTVDRMLASPLVPDVVVEAAQTMAELRQRQKQAMEQVQTYRAVVTTAEDQLAKLGDAIDREREELSRSISMLEVDRTELVQHVADRWGQDTADLFRDI